MLACFGPPTKPKVFRNVAPRGPAPISETVAPAKSIPKKCSDIGVPSNGAIDSQSRWIDYEITYGAFIAKIKPTSSKKFAWNQK
jgi:hypothetical protein